MTVALGCFGCGGGGAKSSSHLGAIQSFVQTGVPSDLAILGNGYFVVSTRSGTSYTRDGALEIDSDGDLIQSSTGGHVLGWQADAQGHVDTTTPVTRTSTLNILIGHIEARTTTSTAMKGNLNASGAPTETYTTQVRVYDALGGAHDLSVVYLNHSTNMGIDPLAPTGAWSSWDWQAYEGDAATGTPVGSSTTAGNEKLYFDDTGSRRSRLTVGTYNKMIVPAGYNSSAFSIKIDFSEIVQFENASQITSTSQDGFPPGTMEGFNISPEGVINGLFTNGLSRPLGQIALAEFQDPKALAADGPYLWKATRLSGEAKIGTVRPRTGNEIYSGYLRRDY